MIGSSVLNYRIEELIGTGGMGSVYRGTNMNIDQKVAIKVLNKNLSDSSLVREWFKNEANLLCQLDHQNIVKFLNFVENEDGIFLIMEYVDGISLDDFIMNKNGLIVEERVYEMFNQILDAFAYAHKQGIVHRDIKPANIILTPDSEGGFVVKILDFGIAGFVSSINENKDWVVGTPSYMSPEQVNNEEIDQRSDIYSLGVLLHQMLTGRTPYDATTLSELMIKDKVVKEPLPRMKDYYAYVSEKMQKVVDKAVDKDKSKRYQSCAEFKKALNPKAKSNTLKYTLIATLVLLIGAGGWFWDYNRVKVRYYKDYVEQWGVPQGIGELSSSEASHSHRHYKFEYQKHKLQRMSHVNSKDVVITDGESERNERPLDVKFHYRENGNIDYANIFDHNGKALYKMQYNEKLNTVIFQYDDEYNTEKNLSAQTVGYVQAFDNSSSSKGKISRWLLSYDDNGFVSKIEYAGFQNLLVCDSHGIYGRKYVRDDKGRAVEIHYIGLDGTPKSTKWGLGIKKYVFDNNDDWVESSYYTINNEPCYDAADGLALYKLKYDKYGNLLEVTYHESDGKLMIPKMNNISGSKLEYDDNGFITKQVYIGADGNICINPTDGTAGFRVVSCDQNGFFTKIENIDTDESICENILGTASTTMVNDAKGNQREWWSYDLNNNINIISNGYAGYKLEIDSIGNITQYVTYGKDQKPCISNTGTAGWIAEYDKYSNQTRLTNIDVELNPIVDLNGVVTWTAEFDAQGNQTKLTFLDAENNVTTSSENISGWNSIYDDCGNEIERNFFNVNDEFCLVSGNYAKWKAKYDDRGNQIECRYYGVTEKPIIIDEGYATAKYKYDDNGNVLEQKYYDTEEEYAKNNLICRYIYDKYDNEIEMAVFDHSDKPTLNGQNWHKRICTYNNRNLVTEERYYGIDGKLTTCNEDKYAIVKYIYDNRGNAIETSYFDTSEKPIECNSGYAKVVNVYDNMNRVIEYSHFDVKGNPTDSKAMVPKGYVKYDKWGNQVYASCEDGVGNPVKNPHGGWVVLKREYNIKGNVLYEAYYDQNDQPMLSNDGYAKVEYSYDNKGNKTEERYLGKDFKSIIPKDMQYAKVKYKYDDQGNIIESRYYGGDDTLLRNIPAIERVVYDEAGRTIETSFFDHNEKPCLNSGNWFHKMVYSDFVGNQAQNIRVYAVNGSLEGHLKYINGEWKQQTIPPSSAKIRAKVAEYNKQCPIFINDQMEISGVKTKGSYGVVISFRLREDSKYNLSKEEIDNYKETFEQVKQQLLSESDFPKGTQFSVVVNDKANRFLFEL